MAKQVTHSHRLVDPKRGFCKCKLGKRTLTYYLTPEALQLVDEPCRMFDDIRKDDTVVWRTGFRFATRELEMTHDDLLGLLVEIKTAIVSGVLDPTTIRHFDQMMEDDISRWVEWQTDDELTPLIKRRIIIFWQKVIHPNRNRQEGLRQEEMVTLAAAAGMGMCGREPTREVVSWLVRWKLIEKRGGAYVYNPKGVLGLNELMKFEVMTALPVAPTGFNPILGYIDEEL